MDHTGLMFRFSIIVDLFLRHEFHLISAAIYCNLTTISMILKIVIIMNMIVPIRHKCGGENKSFLSSKAKTCQTSLRYVPTQASCFAEIGFNTAVFSELILTRLSDYPVSIHIHEPSRVLRDSSYIWRCWVLYSLRGEFKPPADPVSWLRGEFWQEWGVSWQVPDPCPQRYHMEAVARLDCPHCAGCVIVKAMLILTGAEMLSNSPSLKAIASGRVLFPLSVWEYVGGEVTRLDTSSCVILTRVSTSPFMKHWATSCDEWKCHF